MSEPQKTTEHGYIGLRISARSDDEEHRELIMELPVFWETHWQWITTNPHNDRSSLREPWNLTFAVRSSRIVTPFSRQRDRLSGAGNVESN